MSTEQVAWLGKTLSDQAEDRTVAAYKRRRKEREEGLRLADLLDEMVVFALIVTPFLVALSGLGLGLAWLLRRWLA